MCKSCVPKVLIRKTTLAHGTYLQGELQPNKGNNSCMYTRSAAMPEGQLLNMGYIYKVNCNIRETTLAYMHIYKVNCNFTRETFLAHGTYLQNQLQPRKHLRGLSKVCGLPSKLTFLLDLHEIRQNVGFVFNESLYFKKTRKCQKIRKI